MTHPFADRRADYEKYAVPLSGGLYLQVVGAIKAALDLGMLIGFESDVEENETHIRVHTRAKILNKHLPDFEKLPPELQVGYYDGVAESPKQGGKNAQKTNPLEDAETSSRGRALAAAGFCWETLASADEVEIAQSRQGTNGYERSTSRPVRAGGGGGGKGPSEAQLKFLKTLLAASSDHAESFDIAVQNYFGKSVDQLNGKEVSDAISALKAKGSRSIPSF